MKIIIAPAHYVLDSENSGSEFYWAYMLYKTLSDSHENSFLFVTGGIRGIQDSRVSTLKIFSPSLLNLNIFKIIYFHLKLTLVSIKLVAKEKPQVFHHFLPFTVGRSFSIPIILRLAKKRIIGPMFYANEISDSDVVKSNARLTPGVEASWLKEGIFKVSENFILRIFKSIFKWLFIKSISNADKIIAPTAAVEKQLIVDYPFASEKIVRINLGVDTKIFNINKAAFKDKKIINFVSVGLLIGRKRFDRLLEIFALVAKAVPNVRLLVAGDGPEKRALKALAENLKVTSKTEFLGFVKHNDMPQIYSQGHIFLSLSNSEQLGQMYLEAMACGLPIVATKNIGSIECVTEGTTGYLFDENEKAAMVSAIVKMVSDEEALDRMSINSRKRAEEQYCFEEITTRSYLKLYEGH